MTKNIICYSLKTNPSKRTQLHKELYGYTDFSNHGKYKYQRKGILQQTNSKKITDAVILTLNKHVNKILNTLHKYNAKTHTFKIKN